MDTYTYVIKVCIHTTNKRIIITTKNKKIFINTKKQRNNTNSNLSILKSSQKEYHISINRKYYTSNNKIIIRYNKTHNKNKHTIKECIYIITRKLIIKYQNIRKNTIYKHNTKTKDKYNIPLNKRHTICNNETKNTTIWHVCQTKHIYKTKYWYNHQTSKRKNKNTINF